MKKNNRIILSLYKRIFPSWINLLKKELSGCESALDLGCGYSSPIQYCEVTSSIGVDLFSPYLERSEQKIIHSQYIKADIRKIEFKPKSFDAVICLDVLEHLTKKEGYELIQKMERLARRKIIIMTPNGYIYQDGYDDNPLQSHKCGWKVGELRNMGFKVYGINGWKKLRGYKGGIKHKPFILWNMFSDITQKATYYRPKLAFQLFAVKTIRKFDIKEELLTKFKNG